MKQREFTEEFKREAVRILTTSGRSISSVAEDLGIGKSTLDRWRRNFAENDLLSGPHEDMSQELARLRKENELLRQERDLLKKRSRALVRLCAVETDCAILLIGGELPLAYWRHLTPLKNVAHGLLRT